MIIKVKTLTNLVTSLDVLDSNELLGLLVLHQPRHAEISGPDIADQIVTVAVVHDRHVHAGSDGHRRPIHRTKPEKIKTTEASSIFCLQRRNAVTLDGAEYGVVLGWSAKRRSASGGSVRVSDGWKEETFWSAWEMEWWLLVRGKGEGNR